MNILKAITNGTTKRILQSTSTLLSQSSNDLFIQYQSPKLFCCSKRYIWGYVAVAFNQVDMDRLSKVGPNRLCAEWILKNSGGVRFVDSPTKLWKDYNSLPSENHQFRIKVVDASNASIMKIGLEHFKGCQHIDTVIFHNCKHLENNGLVGLKHLTRSLTRLQISGCYNIRDSGLEVVGELSNLKQLLLFDMAFVKNMEDVVHHLSERLPGCDIKVTQLEEQKA